MWNAISLVQDLNSCRRVHFLRPLHHRHRQTIIFRPYRYISYFSSTHSFYVILRMLHSVFLRTLMASVLHNVCYIVYFSKSPNVLLRMLHCVCYIAYFSKILMASTLHYVYQIVYFSEKLLVSVTLCTLHCVFIKGSYSLYVTFRILHHIFFENTRSLCYIVHVTLHNVTLCIFQWFPSS